jgi:hypothetical protein
LSNLLPASRRPEHWRLAQLELAMERTDSFGYWLRRRRKALDLTQAE